MRTGKIDIKKTNSRRSDKSIKTLSHTSISAEEDREKFGSICGGSITPEEDKKIKEKLLAAAVRRMRGAKMQ